MDWPVIGAIAGVTALAGTLCVGAFAVWDSGSSGAKPASGPNLLAERRPVTFERRTIYVVRPPKPEPPALVGPAIPDVQSDTRLAYAQPEVPLADARPDAPKSAARVHHDVPPHSSRRPRDEKRDEKDVKSHRPDSDTKQHAKPAEHEPKRVDHRYDHVMTSSKIHHIRAALRLTREQVAQWGMVEAVLHKIGRDQVAQIQRGGSPEVPSQSAMELYQAAQPLLGGLRDDQKEKVRSLARSLGYPQLASML